MHDFILIRHGQAAAGPSRMDRDQCLTDLGRHQVEATATALQTQGVRPGRIYASRLTRARQTAEILQSRTGGELIIREDLIEHGSRVLLLECCVEEAARLYPECISPEGEVRVSGPGADGSGLTADFCIGGETVDALHERAGAAWRHIIDEQPDVEGQTLIVAHGSFLSAMVGEALRLRRQSVWQVAFANAGYVRLRVCRNTRTGEIEPILCAQETFMG